jgi:hypothetical protein
MMRSGTAQLCATARFKLMLYDVIEAVTMWASGTLQQLAPNMLPAAKHISSNRFCEFEKKTGKGL